MQNCGLFIFIILLITSCSNTEPAVRDVLDEFSMDYLEERLPGNVTLEELRTTLSDSYSSKTNDIPAVFTKVRTQEKVETDPNEGYRIQIYSGQSVEMADTVAARFKTWADTTITGYAPKTYTFFKTPYYRVHVGDFHDREVAILFSNLVKRAFTDAWVVHDRVDPFSVPADTVQMRQ